MTKRYVVSSRMGRRTGRWFMPAGVGGGSRDPRQRAELSILKSPVSVWRAILRAQELLRCRRRLFLQKNTLRHPGWGALAIESAGALWLETRRLSGA